MFITMTSAAIFNENLYKEKIKACSFKTIKQAIVVCLSFNNATILQATGGIFKDRLLFLCKAF